MADGITRIAVEGFKSIVNRQEIEIAPLTVLAGANSSGKSSIIQPLLMLKQTLEATYDPGPLKIDGPNIRFTSSDEFLSKVPNRNHPFSFEITAAHLQFEIIFQKGQSSGIEVLQESLTEAGRGATTLRPDMSADEIRAQVGVKGNGNLSIVPLRFFLNVTGEGTRASMMTWIAPFIEDVIHVPGLRGTTSRTYPGAAVGHGFAGTFEYYTASAVFLWQRQRHQKYEDLIRDMQKLELAQNILAKRLNDAEMQVLVNRTEGSPNDMVSIADVGFGVSQVLPVLVALRAANEGQLVYLEEPEIHLHPRAQVKLADILAAAARRGVRVVAETHSSLLLRAIQTLVANGSLPADLVRLHWFSRSTEGVTHVKSATPDQNGAFGDWPEDFGDVALQSEKEYLDAVESKLPR